MTKSDLIAKLTAQVAAVIGERLVSDIGGVRTYDVSVLIKNADGTANAATQAIYVKDEGQPGEDASFGRRELANETKGTFATALDAKIAAVEGKNGVLKVIIGSVNEDKKFAICTAYTLATGTVTASRKFVVDEAGVLNVYNYTEA